MRHSRTGTDVTGLFDLEMLEPRIMLSTEGADALAAGMGNLAHAMVDVAEADASLNEDLPSTQASIADVYDPAEAIEDPFAFDGLDEGSDTSDAVGSSAEADEEEFQSDASAGFSDGPSAAADIEDHGMRDPDTDSRVPDGARDDAENADVQTCRLTTSLCCANAPPDAGVSNNSGELPARLDGADSYDQEDADAVIVVRGRLAQGDDQPEVSSRKLQGDSSGLDEDFPGSADGIIEGLVAWGDWAESVGLHSIPGARDVRINAPLQDQPDHVRTVNFYYVRAEFEQGDIYRLVIGDSPYDIVVGEGIGSAGELADAFAEIINNGGEFKARTTGTQLRLLGADDEAGTFGAGDLDVSVSSWRNQGVLGQVVPLVDEFHYDAPSANPLDIPALTFGSVADMAAFGNVMQSFCIEPLVTLLAANPAMTLQEMADAMRGLGADRDGTAFAVIEDGVRAEHALDPHGDVNELVFHLPVRYVRDTLGFSLDLGAFAAMHGFRLLEDPEALLEEPLEPLVEVLFDAYVELDFQFGFDLRDGIPDSERFFVALDGDGIRIGISAEVGSFEAGLRAGFLNAGVVDGSLHLEMEMALQWKASALDARGRVTGIDGLQSLMGNIEQTMQVEVSVAEFEVILPLVFDGIDDIVGPGRNPVIRLWADDFANVLPEIELTDFAGVDDFLTISARDVLRAFDDLGDVLRMAGAADVLDLAVPFTDDLALGDVIDLRTFYVDGFLRHFRLENGESAFADWRELQARAEWMVAAFDALREVELRYEPGARRLALRVEMAGDLAVAEAAMGFAHTMGPLRILMSSSRLDVTGEAGLIIEGFVELDPPPVTVTAGALPEDGVLAEDATIEILLQGGVLTDGMPVELFVARDAGRNGAEDLLADIDAALAASVLGGLLRARMDEQGRLVFETTYTGPAPEFVVRVPDAMLVDDGMLVGASRPVAGRFVLEELAGSARFKLAGEGLVAAGRLGALDIRFGGGTLDFCFDADVDLLPDGAARVRELREWLRFGAEGYAPSLSFSVNQRGEGCEGLVLGTITVEGDGDFGAPPLPDARIQIGFMEGFRFPEDLNDPARYLVQYEGDFGDLFKFRELDIGTLLNLLDWLALSVGANTDYDFFNLEIPFLNVAIGNVVDFSGFFKDIYDDVLFRMDGLGSLQRFEEALNERLKVVFGAAWNPEASLDFTDNVLALRIAFAQQLKVEKTLRAELPEPLGTLMDLRGGLDIELELEALGDIRVGLDLSDPWNPLPLILENTELRLEPMIELEPVVLTAGALGLQVGPGYVRLYDGETEGEAALGLLRVAERAAFSDAFSGFDWVVDGTFDAHFPVYFGEEPVGHVTLAFGLDDFDLDFDVHVDLDEIAFNTLDLFDGLDDTVELFFLALEVLIKGEVFGVPIPFIGDSLGSVAAPLLAVGKELQEVFQEISEDDTELVQRLLFDALGPDGLKLLTVAQDEIEVNWIPESEEGEDIEGIEIGLPLGDVVTHDGGLGVSFDMALPFLGLELDAGLEYEISWEWDLSFGVSRSDGFYMLVNEGEAELVFAVEAGFEQDASFSGILGLMFFEAQASEDSGVDLRLGVDFSPGHAGRLSIAQLMGGGYVDVQAQGNAELNLLLTAGFGTPPTPDGRGGALPTFLVDFDLAWEFAGDLSGNVPEVSIGNLRLDPGRFFHDFVYPVVEQVYGYMEPLKPIFDFLRQEIRPLSWGPLRDFFDRTGDGKVTMLDLALFSGYVGEGTVDFLDSVGFLMDLFEEFNARVESADQAAPIVLYDQFFKLSDKLDVRDERVAEHDFDWSTLFPEIVSEDMADRFRKSGGQADGAALYDLMVGFGDAYFEFSLLQPANVLRLLLGFDADLFQMRTPEFTLGIEFEQPITVWSVPTVTLILSAGAGFSAQFGFGFDSSGIGRYLEGGRENPAEIIGGFYVMAGRENPLLTLWGQVGGAVDVNVVVGGARGGLELRLEAAFSLFDPGRGRVYFHQISGIAEREGILGAIYCLMNVDVGVLGRVNIQVYLGRGRFSKTVWSRYIPRDGWWTVMEVPAKEGGACLRGDIQESQADRLESRLDGADNNDTMRDAADLGYAPGIYLKGASIGYAGDVDWYRFELPFDDDLEILMRGDEAFEMSLRDADGVVLGYAGGGSFENKRISAPGLRAGTYYLRVLDPEMQETGDYALSVLPGRHSTTRLLYVAGEQSATPEVHSFYTTAAGDDEAEGAGTRRDVPAATLGHVLSLPEARAGPGERVMILVDSGAFGEHVVLGPEHEGLFIAGAPGQRYQYLPDHTVFGSRFSEVDAGQAVITIRDTSDVTVLGLYIVNSARGVLLENSTGTAFDGVSFLNTRHGISGEGETFDTSVLNSEFHGVWYGLTLPDADGLLVADSSFRGRSISTEQGKTVAGFAIDIGGVGLAVDGVSMAHYGTGLRARNFDDLEVLDFTSSGVMRPFVLEDGGEGRFEGIAVEMVPSGTGEDYWFGMYSPVGLCATDVISVNVNDFDMVGHPETGDFHRYLRSRFIALERVGDFAGGGLTATRVEDGFLADDVGAFALENSVVYGEVTLRAESVRIADSDFYAGPVDIDAVGAVTLTGNLFSGMDYPAWYYDVVTGAWLETALNHAMNVAVAGHTVTLEHNAALGTAVAIRSGAGGVVLRANLARSDRLFDIGGDADIKILGLNDFELSELRVTAAGDVLIEELAFAGSVGMTTTAGGNVTVRQSKIMRAAGHGFLIQTIHGGAVRLEDNTHWGPMDTMIMNAGAVTVDGNTFMGGSLDVISGASLLMADNSISALRARAAVSGGVEVRDNSGRAHWLRFVVGADSEVRANEMGELAVTARDGAYVVVGRNSISGSLEEAVTALWLDGNNTAEFLVEDGSVSRGLFEITRAAGAVVRDMTLSQCGLRVSRSEHVVIRDSSFDQSVFGIELAGVRDAEIYENEITEVLQDGVRIGGTAARPSTRIMVRDNRLSVGSGAGIVAMDEFVNEISIARNTIGGFLEYGVNMSGVVLFDGNEISNCIVGARLQTMGPVVRSNRIFDNHIGLTGSGFLGNDDVTGESFNEIFDNYHTGVVVESGPTVVAFNLIRGGLWAGLQLASDSQARNNVIYGSAGRSVLIDGCHGVQVYNNTIYSADGLYGIRVEGQSTGIDLRNNIVWSRSGTALSVAMDSDVGFHSDYNNYYATDDAALFEWYKEFDDLLDWRIELRHDLHSRGTTRIDPERDRPQFVDKEAGDFRILDSLATTVNSGDPSFAFEHEPGPLGSANGGRINQGAFGNTALAAPSPTAYIRLWSPDFYLDWEPGTVRRIVWESFGIEGNVTLRVVEQGTGWFDDIATVDVGHHPPEFENQPAWQGSLLWSPGMSGLAGDNGRAFRLRLLAGELEAESRETFCVVEPTQDYYLATDGNNRNTGQSAQSAKSAIYAFLDNYGLAANDTVHVAAGRYVLLRNVVISGDPGLGDNEAFTIAGPLPGADAVFDRVDMRSAARAFVVDGSRFVTLENLVIRGGFVGFEARGGSEDLRLRDVRFEGAGGKLLHIHGDSDGAILERIDARDGLGDGVVVEGVMAALRDSVFAGNAGVGARLTDSGNAIITGNRFEGNAGGGLWLHNERLDSSTVVGSEDVSLELGNLFVNNAGTQLFARGRVLVAGNSLWRDDGHAAFGLGHGVVSVGADVLSNVVGGHLVGIEAIGMVTLEGNRVYANTTSGFRLVGDSAIVVARNVVYSSEFGIKATRAGEYVYRNNLIYAVGTAGISHSDGHGALFENNTIHVKGADAIRLSGSRDATVRNQIFSVRDGLGLRLDRVSQDGFASNYNLFDVGEGGAIGRWAGEVRDGFADWRSASFMDARSLADDPLFVDPAGTDGVLGYVSMVQDGRDDAFQLQSLSGSYHGSSLAPVRDAVSGRPVWPVATLNTDENHSPGIARGDENTGFELEPEAGGFVNLGAFGNTEYASHSLEHYVMMLDPRGGETRPVGQRFDVIWRSHDRTGAVDLFVERVGGERERIAAGAPNTGVFDWMVGSTLGTGHDFRMIVERKDGSASGSSAGVFSIAEAVNVYYVNDDAVIAGGFTTAVGHDANDGLDAARPKASVRAILEAYTLSEGDVILVDAGRYELTTAIPLAEDLSGITIRGFSDPERPELFSELVLDDMAAADSIFAFDGARDVVLESMKLDCEGVRGIEAGIGAAVGLTVRDVSFEGNEGVGLHVEQGNPGLKVASSRFAGLERGIYFAGPVGAIVGNTFTDVRHAIEVDGSAAAIENILVEGNRIEGEYDVEVETGIRISGVRAGIADVRHNALAAAGSVFSVGIYVEGPGAVARDNVVVGVLVPEEFRLDPRVPEWAGFDIGIFAIDGARVEDHPQVSHHNIGICLTAHGWGGPELGIAGSVASGNVVSGNATGIVGRFSSVSPNVVTGNRVHSNAWRGIHVDSHAIVTGNSVSGNGLHGMGEGVFVDGPAWAFDYQGIVQGNRIWGNHGDALLIGGGSATVGVYNNVFNVLDVPGEPDATNHAVRIMSVDGRIDLRNNIIIDGLLSVHQREDAGLREDYNLYGGDGVLFEWGTDVFFETVESWYHATGQGKNSFAGAPMLGEAHRPLAGSPAINAGDPWSAWIHEAGQHGGRVNLGAYGNTPDAREGDAFTVQVLNPHFYSKPEAGKPLDIVFLASGFGVGQTAAWYNVGAMPVETWTQLAPRQNFGWSTIPSEIALDLNGVVDGAPEMVYRDYLEFDGQSDFELPIPVGRYRLRLHGVTPSDAADQAFDVAMNGVVLLTDVDWHAVAGGVYRTAITEADFRISDAGAPALLSLTARGGTGYLAGIEIMRLYDEAPADTFTVEVSLDGGTSYSIVTAGVGLDTRGIGRAVWIPVAPGNGADARIRVRSDATGIASVSEPFMIANDGRSFYLNDGSLEDNVYTTAVGHDANCGKRPDRPMRSLNALLTAYKPGAGDTVYVDTGLYELTRNIRLETHHSGVLIKGAYDPMNPLAATVFDRGSQYAGNHVFDFQGAANVTIENIEFRNACHAIYAGAGTASGLTLQNNRFIENRQAGIHVAAENPGLRVEDSYFAGSGHESPIMGGQFYGVKYEGERAIIRNNTFADNWYAGVYISAFGVTPENYVVEANTVSGSFEGIVIAFADQGNAKILDNVVTGRGEFTTGIRGDGAAVLIAGNTVSGAAVGVFARDGARVEHNPHIRNNDIGIELVALTISSSAQGNTVYQNRIGIHARTGATPVFVVANTIRDNAESGVRFGADIRLLNNRVHGNGIGLHMVEGGVGSLQAGIVGGNEVWGNVDSALVVEGDAGDLTVRNNTLLQTGVERATIHVETIGGLTLRDNILVSDGGVALRVAAAAAHAGLDADFNLYDLRGGAMAVAWGPFVFVTRADWFFNTGRGGGSVFEEARFMDERAADFTLRNDSPAVDAGCPNAPWADAGGSPDRRVNIGARGNTAAAVRGATRAVQVLSPFAFSKWTLGQTATIEFLALGFDPVTRFDVEISMNHGETYRLLATDVEVDERGAGMLDWIPDEITNGRNARVRIRPVDTDGPAGYSELFLVANDGYRFYLNDGMMAGTVYTTAAGDDFNCGKRPDRPMRNLQALIAAYQPGDGDVVFMDSGAYGVAVNILLGSLQAGLRISGPHGAWDHTARALLDRRMDVAGAHLFDVVGADGLTLENLKLVGAHTAVALPRAAESGVGAGGVTLRHLVARDNRVGICSEAVSLEVYNVVFRDNADYGMVLKDPVLAPSAGYIIDGVTVENSGTGVRAEVGGVTISDSVFRDNRDYGVWFKSIDALDLAIRDSVWLRNGLEIVDGAAVFAGSEGATIAGNMFMGNRIGVRLSVSGVVRDNVMGLNETGILLEGNGEEDQLSHVEGNRIFGSGQQAVLIEAGRPLLRHNHIHSNTVGIEKPANAHEFAGTLEYNLLYHHAVAAISMHATAPGAILRHNTVYEPVGVAVVLTNSSGVVLAHNIVQVNAGFGIRVDEASAGFVSSDGNLFWNTGDPNARIGEWAGVALPTLADWRAETGQDLQSLFGNPGFFDPAGADDILGYREVDGVLMDGGADDNFHLTRHSAAIGEPDKGAFPFKGDLNDITGPFVTDVTPGGIHTGNTVHGRMGVITVFFSEALNEIDAASGYTFELMRDVNGDGEFGSEDSVYTLKPFYDVASRSVRLRVGEGVLEEGFYRLRIRCAHLRDLSGNELDGDQSGVPGGDYVRLFTITHPPPRILDANVNDGHAGRSMVTSLTVRFEADVGAGVSTETIRIFNRSTDEWVEGAHLRLEWMPDHYAARITFVNMQGASLPNACYQLVIDGDLFGAEIPLDANGDGQPGGIFNLDFHRLFGDSSGNAYLDNLDILRFRATLGSSFHHRSYDARFDFDGGGAVGDMARIAMLESLDAPARPVAGSSGDDASCEPVMAARTSSAQWTPSLSDAAEPSSVAVKAEAHEPAGSTGIGSGVPRWPSVWRMPLAASRHAILDSKEGSGWHDFRPWRHRFSFLTGHDEPQLQEDAGYDGFTI